MNFNTEIEQPSNTPKEEPLQVICSGILKKDDEIPTRVGFVVSKKTHKRAVKRNRLKRLMRESYRLAIKDNQLGNSQKYLSLIFVGTEHALGKSFDEIQNIIKNLIQRLK